MLLTRVKDAVEERNIVEVYLPNSIVQTSIGDEYKLIKLWWFLVDTIIQLSPDVSTQNTNSEKEHKDCVQNY